MTVLRILFAATFIAATCAVVPPFQIATNEISFDLDVFSRQSWVQDLGVRGCNYANSVRAQYGRHKLYYSASLTDLAARHSNWMANYLSFQHQNLNGLGVYIGGQWMGVTAENIAMSRPRTNDAAWDAHEQWYFSRGHFNNMISSSHTHCGVGIAYDRYGRWWATQLFGYNPRAGDEYSAGAVPAAAPAPAPAPAPRSAPAPAPALAPAPAPAPRPASPPARAPRANDDDDDSDDDDDKAATPLIDTQLQSSLLGEPLSTTKDNDDDESLMPDLSKLGTPSLG